MNKKLFLKQLIARQKALTDLAKSKNRALTDEENAKFDELQALIDDIRESLDAKDDGAGDGAGEGEGDTKSADDDEDDNKDGEGEKSVQKAMMAERSRITSINSLCREFGFEDEAPDYISKGASVASVRKSILEGLKKSNGAHTTGIHITEGEADKFIKAAGDALVLRSGVQAKKVADGASDLRSMSLRSLAIECLSRFHGENINKLNRESSDSLFSKLERDFANPTSAFSSILDNAINKTIVELYAAVPTTFEKITTVGTLTDFKESKDHEYLVGGAGELLLVPENGELKADKPQDQLLPKRKLDTYGRQFTMTRQAFINDDIGFISKVPGLYAQKAKKTIDKQVYQMLFNNSTIFDGKTLFHNDHKNLIATGSKPTQASIQEIITAMQKQTDPFGDAIYMTPKAIVVPVGYGFDLKVIFHSAQVTGSSNNDVNPLYNSNIEIVESPVLNVLAGSNACPWFMIADPTSAKGIQVDYLNGQTSPTIRRSEKPGTLGFVWDIYMDWGITAVDYRGIAKNPGVAL